MAVRASNILAARGMYLFMFILSVHEAFLLTISKLSPMPLEQYACWNYSQIYLR